MPDLDQTWPVEAFGFPNALTRRITEFRPTHLKRKQIILNIQQLANIKTLARAVQ